MRRICIAAILAGTLSGPALAQSLRSSYAPDGTSAAARHIATKRIAHVPKAAPMALQPPRSAAVPPNDNAAAAQSYIAPTAASPGANGGLQDFFATIFAGPILLSRAFRPTESSYGASPIYAPQSYWLATVRSTRNIFANKSPIRVVRRRARSLSIPPTSFFI